MNIQNVPTIILVEDDLRLSELVSRYLQSNGFHVTVADLDAQVVEQVQRAMPDLVILDLGLPGQDGFSICRQLRPAYPNPILILTARNSDIDHVLGLELGADDYVIKPVEPRVLLARIKALLRRGTTHAEAEQRIWRFGKLIINTSARSVSLGGQAIALSTNEFDLLVYLAARPSRVATREELLEQVWGYDVPSGARTVDSHVRSLRRKLGSSVVRTVHGVGYAAQDAAS